MSGIHVRINASLAIHRQPFKHRQPRYIERISDSYPRENDCTSHH